MIFQQNFKFGPKDEEQYQEARQLALEFVQQRGYPEEWVDQLVVQLVVPTGKNCCFSIPAVKIKIPSRVKIKIPLLLFNAGR